MTMTDCIDCYAVPGADFFVDVIRPDGLTWCLGHTEAEVLARYPGAVRMTVAEHCAAKAARQHTPIVWEPTTAEQYDEMLNILPPALWLGGAFLVGEPVDHDAETGVPRFRAYLHTAAGRYVVASRPMTCRELRALMTNGGL